MPLDQVAHSMVGMNVAASAGLGSTHVSFNAIANTSSANDAQVATLSLGGSVNAIWADTVTVIDGNPNDPVTIRCRLDLHGALTDSFGSSGPGASGETGMSMTLITDPTSGQFPEPPYCTLPGGTCQPTAAAWAILNDVGGEVTTEDLPPSSVVYTETFIPYKPTLLEYGINIGIHGELAASHTDHVELALDADFSHTLSWGGILSVTDAVTGEPVDDWAIASANGFDYSAVPEPSSGLLLLLGLCPLVIWYRIN